MQPPSPGRLRRHRNQRSHLTRILLRQNSTRRWPCSARGSFPNCSRPTPCRSCVSASRRNHLMDEQLIANCIASFPKVTSDGLTSFLCGKPATDCKPVRPDLDGVHFASAHRCWFHPCETDRQDLFLGKVLLFSSCGHDLWTCSSLAESPCRPCHPSQNLGENVCPVTSVRCIPAWDSENVSPKVDDIRCPSPN